MSKSTPNIDRFPLRVLPSQYHWARPHAESEGPRIVREALKLYGLSEVPGQNHAPEILEMAGYLGGVIEDFYTADEIPWCGLAVSYWIKKANFEPPKNYSQIRARDFAEWGKPSKEPSFGDILVFWRGSPQGRDGHVGLYIMEDPKCYHVLGGNQGNRVSIVRIGKERLIAARRCPWRWMKPFGVRPFKVASATGTISRNEA